MGRNATFYCRTCKQSHHLGYGSAVTWLDGCSTVEEFDARPDATKRIQKNQRMRTCLEQHAGHDFMTHSSDWTHYHADTRVLCGEFGSYGACKTIIDDYDEWTHEDLANPLTQKAHQG